MTVVEIAAQAVATFLGAATAALPAFRRIVAERVRAELPALKATILAELREELATLAGVRRPQPAPPGGAPEVT